MSAYWQVDVADKIGYVQSTRRLYHKSVEEIGLDDLSDTDIPSDSEIAAALGTAHGKGKKRKACDERSSANQARALVARSPHEQSADIGCDVATGAPEAKEETRRRL